MKKQPPVLWFVLVIILLAFYWGYERISSIKDEEERLKAEKKLEILKESKIFERLESTSLFGIRLNDSAIALLLDFKHYGTPLEKKEVWTEEDYLKIMDKNGLLKGTIINFLSTPNFTIKLNDFFDPKVHNGIFIDLNENFEDYYIKYQPYQSGKISTIFANLKTEYVDHIKCVKDLRPYADIILERIKFQNPDKDIIITDNFYPKINGELNYPSIKFGYKYNLNAFGDTVLTIRGICSPSLKKAFIEIEATAQTVDFKKHRKIMKKIREQKELDYKNEFNNSANEAKSEIDKSGL
jgi:hypothetical protein